MSIEVPHHFANFPLDEHTRSSTGNKKRLSSFFKGDFRNELQEEESMSTFKSCRLMRDPKNHLHSIYKLYTCITLEKNGVGSILKGFSSIIDAYWTD